MTDASRPHWPDARSSVTADARHLRSADVGNSSPVDVSRLRWAAAGSSSPAGVSRSHSAGAGNSPAERFAEPAAPGRAAGAQGPHYVERAAARGACPARPGPRMSAPSTSLPEQVTVPHCAVPVSPHRFLTCSIHFSFTRAQREHEPAQMRFCGHVVSYENTPTS